jgi:hypothetical protein
MMFPLIPSDGSPIGRMTDNAEIIPGQKSACTKFHQIRNDKRASRQLAVADEKPTSRYEFGQLPRSPFQANFRVADDAPETENSGAGE